MKSIKNKKIFLIIISVIFISFFYKIVFAAWNGLPFNPGTIDNPDCLPSQINCDVLPSITFESDPVFIASQAFNITGANISNWNTAYSWGDHRTMGYVTGTPWTAMGYVTGTPWTTEGYVTGTPWTAMGYITDGNTGWDNSYGFITSYTETDPNYSASQAHSITSTDITNLSHLSGVNTGDETNSTIKTKLGVATNSNDGYLSSSDWTTFNNKQPAGSYLTSYTETDPIFLASQAHNITATDITHLGNLSGTNTGDQNLSGLIPYTGGTTDVDLGVHNLTVDTNSLFVDSINHRVGIGKTNPTTPLDVVGYITASSGYKFGFSPNAQFGIAYSPFPTLNTFFDYEGDFNFRSLPSYNSSLFIKNNGNIGVGTATPLAKLQVKGNGATTGKAFSVIDSNGLENTYIQDNGDIVIGAADGKIKGLSGNYINIYNSSTGGFDFFPLNGGASGAQSRFYGGLMTDGKLSVGTSSTTSTLNVLGDSTLTGNIYMGGAADRKIYGGPLNTVYINLYNASTGGFDFYTNGGVSASKFYGALETTGNLTVGGTLGLSGLNMGASGIISGGSGWMDNSTLNLYDGATGNYYFTTGKRLNTSYKWFTHQTVEKMTLLNNGNLGIGVSSPTSILQVSQLAAGEGTVTTNGTTALVGTNTQFTNTFKVGDTITVSGETVRTIATITDNTNLTVTVAFSTTTSGLSYTLAGGDRFAVKGNGYVGIGTTAPTDALTLANTKNLVLYNTADQTTNYGSLRQEYVSGDSAWEIRATGGLPAYSKPIRIQSNYQEGNPGISYLQINRQSNPSFTFYTNPTSNTGNFLKFDFTSLASSGSVNFFDAAPTVNQSGTAGFTAFRVSPYLQTTGSGTNLLFDVGTNSATGGGGTHTSKMVIDSTGNVGIGTTAPSGRLDVHGSTSDNTAFSFQAANSGGTALLAVRNDGNVGIGTTAPNSKLEVVGAGSYTDGLIVRATNSASYAALTMKDDRNSNSYVGQFGLYGTAATGNISNMFFYNTAGGGIDFYTGTGTPSVDLKMRILSTGNVGINKSSPTSTLDVDGVISSDLGFNITTVTPPTAPTLALVSDSNTAHLGAGQYYYRITYTTALGETSSGVVASIITDTNNRSVQLSNIPISTNAKVTGRKIYRTRVGLTSDTGYLLATINDVTTTTFLDAIPDSSLSGDPWIGYKANTTSKYISVNGNRSMVLDSYLTTLGVNAGKSATSAGLSVMVGSNAGYNTTSGFDNIYIGANAGYSNTTGGTNVAIGYLSQYVQTTGSANVTLGEQTLRYNVTGSYNTGVGQGALQGQSGFNMQGNVGVGIGSGAVITTGAYNTILGSWAGYGYNGFLGHSVPQIGDVNYSSSLGVDSFTSASFQTQIGAPYMQTAILNGDTYIKRENSLGSEILTNGSLTTGTSWSSTNDASLTADTAVWSYSGGAASTLTQTNANLALKTNGSRWYKFTYTISNKTGNPSAFITTTTSNVSTPLYLTGNGTHSIYFVSAVAPTDFIITSTLTSGQAFTLDTFSLKEVVGGNLGVNGNIGIGTNNPTTRLEIGSSDLGNGLAGPIITLGRNTNATNAGAGSINFLDKAGLSGYVWQDAAGNMRINNAAPTTANDTAGVVIGAQTSERATKQDIEDYTDYSNALSMIVNAPLHTFRYIREVSGYGPDSPLAKTHIGYISDEVDPMFMSGNVIDQVSVNGLLMASIKELNLTLQDIAIPVDDTNKSFIERFYEKMIAWLGSSDNGLEKICVKKSDGSEFCVNGDQLEQAVNGLSNTNTTPAPVISSPEPTVVPTPAEPTVVTPEVTPEPTVVNPDVTLEPTVVTPPDFGSTTEPIVTPDTTLL